MKRTVLSVAWPFAPVGPDAVGGAEQILTDLDEALVQSGNISLVVACEGSRPAGELFPAPLPPGLVDQADRQLCARAFQEAIDKALASRPVDLVHMHGLDFHRYRIPEHIPVLVTLHLPPSWYPAEMLNALRPGVQLQCVSRSQRDACPPEAGDFPVVENGVALTPPGDPEGADPDAVGEFALLLGRICPEKNVHAALDAGRVAELPVLIGGRVFPYEAHQAYFRQEVIPRLRDGNLFLGNLLPERRQSLLRKARCLLLPSLAPETSSLVAMEAMAAGTPVVAWRSGAIPEIVEDGVTGFLVESVEGMANAIRRVPALDRRVCRTVAEQRFSRERMIRDYFRLYERCIERCMERGAAEARSVHA